MKTSNLSLCQGILCVSIPAASVFNGHRAAQGPLSLSIGQVSQVETVNRPCDIKVTVPHSGHDTLEVRLPMTGLTSMTERDSSTRFWKHVNIGVMRFAGSRMNSVAW